jgi:hypothetical protein
MLPICDIIEQQWIIKGEIYVVWDEEKYDMMVAFGWVGIKVQLDLLQMIFLRYWGLKKWK